MRPVDILRLVHEQVGAPGPPASQQQRSRFEQSQGPSDEVVEIEPTGAGDGALVAEECPRDGPRLGILADLRRTMDPDTVWSRFSVGREGTIRWYRAVYERLREVGFEASILEELRDVAEALEHYSA